MAVAKHYEWITAMLFKQCSVFHVKYLARETCFEYLLLVRKLYYNIETIQPLKFFPTEQDHLR